MRILILLAAALILLAGCDKPIHEASAPIHWELGR